MPPKCPTARERWIEELRRLYVDGTLDAYLFGEQMKIGPLLEAVAQSLPARER